MFEMPATILLLEQGGPLVGVFSICLSLLLVFVQETLVGSNCYYGDIPPYCDSSPDMAISGHIWFFHFQSIVTLWNLGVERQHPKRKSRGLSNSIGLDLDEAWERCAPLKCFDKAIWVSGERFKDERPRTLNWQQFTLPQWAHLFTVSRLLGKPQGFTAPSPLGVLDL